MAIHCSIGQKPAKEKISLPAGFQRRRVIVLFVMALLLFRGTLSFGAEPALSEYQVKALFLFNFAKYVDWPANAFAGDAAPLIIGIEDEDQTRAELQKVVEGKMINGHRITILSMEKDADFSKCHIVFMGASSKKRLVEMLGKAKSFPVLTVGESEQFLTRGGMINFLKKENKIRLEINLDASYGAGLKISSKLLSVADAVHGKQ